MEFQQKLIRLAGNRSRGRLCEKAGVRSDHTLKAPFTPGYVPTLHDAVRLARVLNVSLEWLADDSLDLPPVPAHAAEPVPGETAAPLTPDDHARHLIRHAAEVLRGPALFAAVACVSAVLAGTDDPAPAADDPAAGPAPDAAATAGDGGGPPRVTTPAGRPDATSRPPVLPPFDAAGDGRGSGVAD